MPRIGPKGLEFARARIEMKAAETVLHLARAEPRACGGWFRLMSGGSSRLTA